MLEGVLASFLAGVVILSAAARGETGCPGLTEDHRIAIEAVIGQLVKGEISGDTALQRMTEIIPVECRSLLVDRQDSTKSFTQTSDEEAQAR
jgi:hypothetical protein